jgi:hypothetical protein
MARRPRDMALTYIAPTACDRTNSFATRSIARVRLE